MAKDYKRGNLDRTSLDTGSGFEFVPRGSARGPLAFKQVLATLHGLLLKQTS